MRYLANLTNSPRFDVQIENGQLLLAPLKGRADIEDQWKGNDKVTATIANLAKYLGAADTNGNITISPSAAEVQIKNLKLRGANVGEVVGAVQVATDGAVSGSMGVDGEGRYECTFQVLNGQPNPPRTVEVFDIQGYVNYVRVMFGNNDAEVGKKLDEIQDLVAHTLKELHADDPSLVHLPQFTYHKGTGLLVVVGSPEAIDVTRKFVNALIDQYREELQVPLDNRATRQQK